VVCLCRYTEQEFDHEFVEELSKWIYGFIKSQVSLRQDSRDIHGTIDIFHPHGRPCRIRPVTALKS
jgi:hypothetical protein